MHRVQFAGRCKEFVGMEGDRLEYSTKVCTNNKNALDIYMKRISDIAETGSETTESNKASNNEEYTLNGDLAVNGGVELQDMLYFDQSTVENIKAALQAYIECLTTDIKIDQQHCKMPVGLAYDSRKQKKITITLDEDSEGKYLVKSFKIKAIHSRRRRSCDDKKPEETCHDLGPLTPDPLTAVKFRVRRSSFSSMMSSLHSSEDKVQKVNIRVVGERVVEQQPSRARRSVQWLSMEKVLWEKRIPKSLDLLVDSLSAMSQANLL